MSPRLPRWSLSPGHLSGPAGARVRRPLRPSGCRSFGPHIKTQWPSARFTVFSVMVAAVGCWARPEDVWGRRIPHSRSRNFASAASSCWTSSCAVHVPERCAALAVPGGGGEAGTAGHPCFPRGRQGRSREGDVAPIREAERSHESSLPESSRVSRSPACHSSSQVALRSLCSAEVA